MNLPARDAHADPTGLFASNGRNLGSLHTVDTVAGQIKKGKTSSITRRGPSMRRWQCNGMASLLAVCWFGLAGSAWAGPYVNVMQPCDCPPNHYSALHVLFPAFYRWAAWCQGPCRYTFARALHPDVATTFYLKRYHCPSVNPLQFSLQNYVGLNGTPPSSSYQSSAQTGQAGQAVQGGQEPLQQLPPPSAEKLSPPEKLPPPSAEPDKK